MDTRKMDLRRIAEELQRVGSRRGQAATAIEEAVTAVRQAFNAIEDAHRSSLGLHRAHALYGDSFTELTELVEHLGQVGELLAEIGLVLTDLHPNELQFDETIQMLAPAARNGLEHKRLADWEDQTLRAIVVKALAGEAPKP